MSQTTETAGSSEPAENNETELPVVMSERLVPPTSVEIAVGQKGEWVELHIGTQDRTVDDFVWLRPEDAARLRDELTSELARREESE